MSASRSQPKVNYFITAFGTSGSNAVIRCMEVFLVPGMLHFTSWSSSIQLSGRRETASVTMLVDGAKGAASGGTIASVFGLFNEPRDVQRSIVDPYCLDPPDSTCAVSGIIEPSPIIILICICIHTEIILNYTGWRMLLYLNFNPCVGCFQNYWY